LEPTIGSIFQGIIHLPLKMEPIEGSKTLAFRTQTPRNYPKENILQPWWFIVFVNVLALEEQALYQDMQMAPLYGTMLLKTQVWNSR
jgi:hypothetical protein